MQKTFLTAPPCACRGVALAIPLKRHLSSPLCAGEAEREKSKVKTQPRVAWSTRTALKTKKLKPKRSLGQNFLQREEVLRAIVAAAELQSGDRVLEIGPGTGNLTRYLLKTGARVTAVEKDDALYAALLEQFDQEIQRGQLRLVHSDVLDLPTKQLLQAAHDREDLSEVPPLKLVANLPYNITKLAMRKLLPLGDNLSHLYLMLQDEVALRLVAGPTSGLDYRAMNVEVAFYSNPTYLFQVDRTAYFPEPNVDGAIVCFKLKPSSQYPLREDLNFMNMVRQAFTERRKMVRNTLHSMFDPPTVASALTAAGICDSARPQQLTLENYVSLWQNLQAHSQ